MRSKHLLTILLLVLAAARGACTRGPPLAKQKNLASGNRYFAKGKYKEARIMYLDALQKDQKFGPAHYQLGLTALKIGPVRDAVNAFRRSIELLPADSPDHWDSRVKLSELYLLVAREQKQFLDEVDDNCKRLLKRDPKSFDGHRLTGDLHMARSILALKTAQREEAAELLKAAAQEYELANQTKGGDEGVLSQLARANAALGDYAKAEALYKQILDKNKTYQAAYSELYKLYLFQRKAQEGESSATSTSASATATPPSASTRRGSPRIRRRRSPTRSA
jgi:tetratricopeptide (TPR) repeat protein